MSASATLVKSDVDFEHARIIHQTRDTKGENEHLIFWTKPFRCLVVSIAWQKPWKLICSVLLHNKFCFEQLEI